MLPIVQDRPPFKLDMLTWDDHDCEELYLPAVLNASAVTVRLGASVPACHWQDCGN